MGPDVVSYSIWPFAIIHETRPEFKALLAPITRDFFSFIRNDENPNGLWAWLSEDLVTVQEQLTTFESKPPDYWWKFAYGSKKYNDWLDEPNHTTANGKESPRLDYIVLDGLAEKGTPRGLGASTNDWVQMFFDASIEGLNHFIAKIKEEFEKFGIYVRTEILKTGEVFQEIWRNTKEFSIKKWTEGLGRITYLKTWNQIGELKLFWREQFDGKWVEEYWNKTDKYWKGVWSDYTATADKMIEQVILTNDDILSEEFWNANDLKYWKGVWSDSTGAADKMIERIKIQKSDILTQEIWNSKLDNNKYWKGMWSDSTGDAEKMIERMIIAADNSLSSEYWRRATEKYYKGVWVDSKMRYKYVIRLDDHIVIDVWNEAGQLGASIFDAAGKLIESLGKIPPVTLPDWWPPKVNMPRW